MLLKFIILVFGLCLSAVHGQNCQGRLNGTSTGRCTDRLECTGSSLSVDACEMRSCCVNSTDPIPNYNCMNRTAFLTVYNSTRGAYIAKILDYAIFTAGICQNCQAKAAFLAIAATMTDDFKNDEAIGTDTQFTPDDRRYGNSKVGDGSRFRRRGFFGIRGTGIYEKLQGSMRPYQFFRTPELAADPWIAAQIAAKLWKSPKLQAESPLTQFADGTFYGFSMLWDQLYGETEYLPKAAEKYSMFLRLFQCGGDLYPGIGPECQYNQTRKGYCVPNCIPGLEDIAEICGCSGETTGSCSGPPHIRCCIDSCNQELKMDLGLVLDSSGSIGLTDYGKLKEFVVALLREVNVGANKTHVTIINYSNTAETLTYLNTDYNLTSKIRIAENARFMNSGTDTALALRTANSAFAYNRGLRQPEEGASQVIFVITDGASNDQTATLRAATTLKQNGIHLVSVGVGSSLNLGELYAMCTPPANENYFSITNYGALNQKLNQFVSKSCSEPVVVPANTTVTGDVSKGKYKFLKLKIIVTGNKIMIKVKLFNGKVKLFYSFKSRNPKDPADFITYLTTTTYATPTTSSSVNAARKLLSKIFEPTQKQLPKAAAGDETVTMVVDKPYNIEEFDFVYVGVKGVEEENQFEVVLEDCELVFCPSSAALANRLSIIVSFLCIIFSMKFW